MKLIYTYLFIFLYVGALIRPIVPVIDYNLNYDYIAKVLCINKDEPELKCNGKCHLAKEIKKTLPSDNQDKPSGLPVIDFDKFPITSHENDHHKLNTFQFSNRLNFFSNKIGKIKNYIEIQFQPPEFLV
ncbi:hypothetical protein FF125_13960 [Aureibaculum algae]|uniref:Uncharacterized protein n=1 Tax=Aureibaculum algae TaxID=2584122 RepID=A0A5B7TTC2_9FLAO|nr:hypothetical protein [Aureibaculum algae]QCX39488.1 hypothetical protein FF125_13960 [Aureibaculum algae]